MWKIAESLSHFVSSDDPLGELADAEEKEEGWGKSTPLKTGASQRMALDALIAVSACRQKTTVVTINWGDFEAIRYYCDVKVIKASGYFKR